MSDLDELIHIADYNLEWPQQFQDEKCAILQATAGHIVALEHVGSTAVPGLAAKPVLDLLGGVSCLPDADACVPAMRNLGYQYVPEFERDMPERRFFRKPDAGLRTHHVHGKIEPKAATAPARSRT